MGRAFWREVKVVSKKGLPNAGDGWKKRRTILLTVRLFVYIFFNQSWGFPFE